MKDIEIIATSTFGLESVVAQEIKNLGYTDTTIQNGRVTFKGNLKDIAICNTWLRTADRVLIKMGEFKAETFDELFDQTKDIDWGELIPVDGVMHVNGKSVKSTLFSVPNCQGIVKKAIVESMKRTYKTNYFPEDGSTFKIEVSLLKDIATITIDTSGHGLHKRGYREVTGEAPLKETLAAAMILLSRWDNTRALADIMCGIGTIPIEASLIGRNIAPGLRRSFVAETWDFIDKKIWSDVRAEAQSKINDAEFRILASDKNYHMLKIAKDNAEKAGVDEYIGFQKIDFGDFSSKRKYGCIITNPPYGERLGEKEEVIEIYESMGELYDRLDEWSFFVLTSHPQFEKVFGARATKNRKLYNGNILCYFYQYLGALPPKHFD